MKKIAIIYSGETRSIEKTIDNFCKNMLINDNYHVFALIQSFDRKEHYENLIKNKMKDNLKSFNWFYKDDNEWLSIREDLLKNIMISERWKDYLRNSGSMIEYYQMYLLSKKIFEYEKIENFEYDYIIKVRCDNIIQHPIYFDWENLNHNYVKESLQFIKNHFNFDKINSIHCIRLFMNSLFDKKRIFCKNLCYLNYDYFDIQSSQLNSLINIENNDDEFIKEFINYINNGEYIFTLRANNIYFLKRKYFKKISNLGINYGKYIMKNHDCWFNAESQLQQICIENNLDIFNSFTTLEDKCLYEYNHLNYFDDENNIKYSNQFFFFVCRN